jgi:hypothetical protein
MTQFIKVTVVVSNLLPNNPKYLIRYFNAHYVHRLEPASEYSPYTKIRILDYHGSDGYEEFRIEETPEEIFAQLNR